MLPVVKQENNELRTFKFKHQPNSCQALPLEVICLSSEDKRVPIYNREFLIGCNRALLRLEWRAQHCPSPRTLNIRRNNVLETGSISILRRSKVDTLLGPLERAKLKHWTDRGFLFLRGPNRVDMSFPLACERKQIQSPKRCAV
jgi:hypothetical protein